MGIREAVESDLKEIIEIYNQSIKLKMATADITEIKHRDRIAWFYSHNMKRYPIYVYVMDEKVVGWISVSPYRPGREALKYTVEVSYYIHNDYKGRGIATGLMEYTIDKCCKLNIKTIFAIILEKNEPSINFVKKFNFEKWGFMPRVADFDGDECGHFYYGLRIVD